eukprot:Colp12_sorted_trinity150504_noHs@3643
MGEVTLGNLGLALLVGVILIDLAFDLGGNPDSAFAYYKHHETTATQGPLLVQLIVPVPIVIAFISLIHNTYRKGTYHDAVTIGSSLLALYSFAANILPARADMVQLPGASEASEHLELIKNNHIFCVQALMVALLFQLLKKDVRVVDKKDDEADEKED